MFLDIFTILLDLKAPLNDQIQQNLAKEASEKFVILMKLAILSPIVAFQRIM
jgi:hypothetical protein